MEKIMNIIREMSTWGKGSLGKAWELRVEEEAGRARMLMWGLGSV